MILDCQVVDAAADLAALRPEWEQLLEGLEQTTPFQLPSWLITWWDHFGSGRLQVLVFRREGRLVGVVPLFLHTWNDRRQLTLLGSGISDYLDPAIASGYDEWVRSGTEAYLAETAARDEWDICDWQDLSSVTPFTQVAGAVLQDADPCMEVLLEGTFADFWDGRSKDLRRNVRRYRERAGAEGPVTFSIADEATDELLDTLIRLHSLRWQQRGEGGTIAANSAEAFLRDVMPQLAAAGRIRIFSIRFKAEIAALVLTFLHRRRTYSYLSAFDPAYEILGFGRLLLYEAFRHCFAEGVVAWNFLRGEEAYKLSWGARHIPRTRVQIERFAFQRKDADTGQPSS